MDRGERGEIVVRGSLVMAGYYQDPEATAAASQYGWHHTADIGFLDDDDYLYKVDWAKDRIITGWFNLCAAEVEQALMSYPAVLQPHPGLIVTESEMRNYVKSRLGGVKTPKQVEVCGTICRARRSARS